MMRRFAVLAFAAGVALTTGCARPAMRSFTAGETGCTEDEIVILETNQGFSTVSWVAECHGQQYVCSSPGCTLRPRPPSEARLEDIRRERSVQPGQTLTFAASEGEIRAVRATLVSVDSKVTFTVGPEHIDEVVVRVSSTTRVPLSGCENVSFHSGQSVESAPLGAELDARFPLATLSRIFSHGPSRKTARFCGRVLLINTPEQRLFGRLHESVARLGSPNTSGGESPPHDTQTPVTPTTASRAVRARLSAESSTLYACAGTTGPLRVLAAWDDEGAVTITIDGMDGAVNECVQGSVAWGALEVEAAGSLIHVVQEPSAE
ncbi:MAG: hypothetical protein AB8H86_34310 [Polyangiales bacterium]